MTKSARLAAVQEFGNATKTSLVSKFNEGDYLEVSRLAAELYALAREARALSLPFEADPPPADVKE